MFEALKQGFWKALTPDLVADDTAAKPLASDEAALPQALLAALGGAANLKSRQRVALTRVRVQVKDEAKVDRAALLADSTAVMVLPGAVFHILRGLG